MISDEQCRAARALLGWSPEDLASKSGVPVDTVIDFENGKHIDKPSRSDLQQVMAEEGCIFRDRGVTRPRLVERANSNEKKFLRDGKKEENENFALTATPQLVALRVTLNTELSILKRQQQAVLSRIVRISNELRRRNSVGDDVDVSEHAVVRFVERKLNINVKEIRRQIRQAIPPDAVRGDKFTVDGITYVISHNGRVTTLYQDEEEEPSVEV